MLAVEGLTKDYRSLRAVEELSFRVQAGEIVGLLGPNGAGKTTVLRCITGIIQRTRGRIVIGGTDLAEDEQAAKARVGYVPEVPNPYDMLTVEEHLEFVARAFGATDGWRARGDELLERLELSGKRDELVLALSKGMKQKLALACAMVHEPPLLLLDEPLHGIDPRGQRDTKAMLVAARAAGHALLVSTHNLSTAQELCDRILILNHGRKLAEGNLAALSERARLGVDSTLEDVFLTLTDDGTADAAPDLA